MTALLSITYLGPIHYFSRLLKYDEIYIESCENYTKQTYRNRCIIYGANGRLPLSIPVLKGDEHKTLIRNVRIDNDKNWQSLHWRGIESAYRSSPFFEFYIDDLAGFYTEKYDFLFDFNIEILNKILSLLEVSVTIRLTNEFNPVAAENVDDMRDFIHPKKPYQSDYAFSPVYYKQVFSDKHGFLANLSIIDLIFNEGPGAVEILRKSILSK